MFTVLCKKCNKKVSTGEVRLQADKSYVCFSCAGYRTDSQSKNTPFQAPASGAPKEKVRVQCLKCKYEFGLKQGAARKCPYCNSERLEEKKGTAQKLIDMHIPIREE